MSSIPQNTENKNEIFDSATKFLKEFQVGKILFQCNAGKLSSRKIKFLSPAQKQRIIISVP